MKRVILAAAVAALSFGVWALPEGYQELEWIESSGTQYIKTGLNAKNSYWFLGRFKCLAQGELTDDLIPIYGVFTSASSAQALFMRPSTGKFVFADPNEIADADFAVGDTIDFEASLAQMRVNGQICRGVCSFSAVTTVDMPLFAVHRTGDYQTYGSSLRLYRFKVADVVGTTTDTIEAGESVLVRDFVPARETASGNVGLYDRVNAVFHPSETDDNFIAGPAVTPLESSYATGGELSRVGADFVHVFTTSGTFTPSETLSARVLVVGGGGNGGGTIGGGGGGGQVVESRDVVFTAGETYAVTVGAGGFIANIGHRTVGVNGGDTTISGAGVSLTAIGGGAGGGIDKNAGKAGGNGGGVGGGKSCGTGAEGGYSGGISILNRFTGGGGGAGGEGGIGGLNKKCGDGGPGYLCDITGELLDYAAGGGGGAGYDSVTNGLAGGPSAGAGSMNVKSPILRGEDALFGRGGGGGGGGFPNNTLRSGGNGGAGAVIIRYLGVEPDEALVVSGEPANLGTPTPAYGPYEGLAADESVTCTMPVTVVDGEGTVKYRLHGWELWSLNAETGARTLVRSSENPAEGEGADRCNYVHNGYSELVWHWEVRDTLGVGVPRVTAHLFRSAEVEVDVNGIGYEADSATLTFVYGESADALDKEVTVKAQLTDKGTYAARLNVLSDETTYYVKAVLDCENGERATSSEALRLVQPRTFEPFPGARAMPEGIVQMEKLVSTGKEWIKTDFVPEKDKTELEMVFTISPDWTGGSLFGQDWTEARFIVDGVSSFRYLMSAASSTGIPIVKGDDYRLSCQVGGIVRMYNDTTGESWIHSGEGNIASVNPIYVFGRYDSDTTAVGLSKYSIASLTLGIAGDLKHDFVPAYEPATGKVGLYDLVTKEMFVSSGTADFVRQEDVFVGYPIARRGAQLVVTVPVADHARTARVLYGANYGGYGAEGWEFASDPVPVAAGATEIVVDPPADWGVELPYVKVAVTDGDEVACSKALVYEVQPNPSVANLVEEGTAFGTARFGFDLTWLGDGATSAAAKLVYGAASDALTEEQEFDASYTIEGHYGNLRIENLAEGSYFAKLVLTNDMGRSAASDVVAFTVEVEPSEAELKKFVPELVAPPIPAGYQRLAYVVKPKGGCQLNTGVYPDKHSRIQLGYQLDPDASLSNPIGLFGARNGGYNFYLWINFNSTYWFAPGYGTKENLSTQKHEMIEGDVDVELSAKGLFVNSECLYSEADFAGFLKDTTSSGTINLGSVAGDSRDFVGRFYSVKIWSGDDIVRWYVPCRETGGEGRVGFYDCMADEPGIVQPITGSYGAGPDAADAGNGRLLAVRHGELGGQVPVAPSYGTYKFVRPGEPLKFETFASYTTPEGAFALSGYTVRTNGVEAFSGNARYFEMTMPEAETEVEWQWSVLYATTLTVEGEGGDARAEQPAVAHGGTARFTATPDEGYSVMWTGADVPNEKLFGNELELENLQGPTAVTASFFQHSANAGVAKGLFTNYAHSVAITFPAFGSETALVDFPAVIRLSEGKGGFSYAHCVTADGRDVRFCDDAGNELASEVVSWNSSGTSEFRVRIPSLGPRTARIYLVWGNADAPARPVGTTAYDETVRAAWGLDGRTGFLFDGSLHDFHGVCDTNHVSAVDGVVGGARHFDGGQGDTTMLGYGHSRQLEPHDFTASCWFRVAEMPTGEMVFLSSAMGWGGGDAGSARIGLDAQGRVFGTLTGDGYTLTAAEPVTAGEWHYVSFSVSNDGGNLMLSVDGVCADTREGEGPSWYSNWGVWGNPIYAQYREPVRLGVSRRYSSAQSPFAGDLDEVTLDEVAHDAGWARACYLMGASNETFAVFGSVVPSLMVTSDEHLPDAAGLALGARPLAPEFSASAPASFEQDGVRWTRTGYTLAADGKVLAAGDADSVSRAWPEAAKSVVVNWTWEKEYQVTTNGVSSWVKDGALVKVAAPAAPEGNLFHSWEGDVPKVQTFCESFETTVTRPLTISPLFAPFTRVEANGDVDALKDAVNAVGSGTEPHVILLGDGSFTATGLPHVVACPVTAPLVIKSEHGAGFTTISNANKTGVFSFATNRAAVVGVRFRPVPDTQANVVKLASGTYNLVDCVLDGENADSPDSRGVLSLSGGLMYRCVVQNFKILSSLVSLSSSWGEPAMVDSCIVTNNVLTMTPVSIDGMTIVRNSLFAKNRPNGARGYKGGAIVFSSRCKGSKAENCTFADNLNNASTSVGNEGGALYSECRLPVVNTVFSGNATMIADDGDDFYGPLCIAYSASRQLSGGEPGCLTALPAFKEDASGETDPLYRTKAISVTTDAGYPTAASGDAGAKDVAGGARLYGAAVDIGAAEYQPTGDEGLEIDVRPNVSEGLDTLTVRFDVVVSGAKGELTYLWDFGDGTPTSDAAKPSHTYAAAGYYTVTLTVGDGTSTKTYTGANLIKVKPSVCYVNEAGSQTVPYATPETGAQSIGQVLGQSPKKIVICANTKVRRLSANWAPCVISYPCEIVGEDRATSVIAEEQIRLSSPGAIIHNLTVANTWAHSASGQGSLYVVQGVASNIIVRNATPNNTGAVMLDAGATLVDSLLFANCTYENGSQMTPNERIAAVTLVGAGALIDRCVITNNFSTGWYAGRGAGVCVSAEYNPAPIVRNSLIAHNHVHDSVHKKGTGGAGIYADGSVVVENCTVVSNDAIGAGAGVYLAKGANSQFVNTIVALNTSSMVTNLGQIVSNEVYVASGAAATWTNCRVPAEAGIDDGGVTTADPKFNFGRRASVPYWGILGDSPLKNKGEKLDWMTPETKDLGGQKRVFNAKPDLGCYESQVGGTVIIVR